MRLALAVFLSIIIFGCTTTPTQVGEGKQIPEKRIYNSEYLSPHDGYEKVTFTRDKGFLGSACAFIIFVDNNKAFGLRQGNVVTTYLKPGDHFFRTESGCRGVAVMSVSTILVKGEPQEFRISLSMQQANFSRTK
jgi:hypothetical protein